METTTSKPMENSRPLGSTVTPAGVLFRLWAPHAKSVSVVGSFNTWDPQKNPMNLLGEGIWESLIPGVHVGDQYRYLIITESGEFNRIDPYAREVTNSTGNAIVHDIQFDWENDPFAISGWNALVIYELHIGTFNDPQGDSEQGTFDSAIAKLTHLKKLGVNAVQIMPIGQFEGARSWGYNPSHIFAVETTYGGPIGLKKFVKRAHQEGIAVILDVVYNHFGPGDLDIWQFDGWSQNSKGGIYFYNDERSHTPWGETRPDYGRNEVRRYIIDNVLMWLEEYRVDGLRFDCTQFIRTINGSGSQDIPEGWSLLQEVNNAVAQRFPGKITSAEDLQNNRWLTKSIGSGGAGFSSQWDGMFVHPIRQAVITSDDAQRSIRAIADAICYRYNDDAFDRVIYSESHDEVANGSARVPQEINPKDPTGWHAQKRSTLAAALVFTSPGIPMLFQGQEFLEGGWFRDSVPVDWDQSIEFRGIVRLYRDLIGLRLNRVGFAKGLIGQFTQIYHLHEDRKLIAFHRWDQGGPGDDVVIIANFLHEPQEEYVLGFPSSGTWKLRFNSDWEGYSETFGNFRSKDVVTQNGQTDSFPYYAAISIAPYSVLVFSQPIDIP
jgi:1,4-alpha-glucan branching enzyme